ncbi:MAG: MMPL family transporter [Acidimicrobiales bacterium]|nr:MMPL family transporter [Acidimicrobiales bacterium]
MPTSMIDRAPAVSPPADEGGDGASPRDGSLLSRLGAWCFDHRRAAVALWAGLLAVVFVAAGAVGPAFDSGSAAPASDSDAGFAALEAHFPELGTGGQSGTIVFRAEQGVDDPEVVGAMEELFATVDAGFPDEEGVPSAPGATVVSPYSDQGAGQIATAGPLAGRLAFATVHLSADIDDTESARIGELIAEEAPSIEGLEVLAGGQYLATIEPPQTELIGIAFAIVVLIVSFGSVLAMGLPIAVALGGVGIGLGSVVLLTQVATVPEDTMLLGTMVGLGVGIDYALFIVTRYREAAAAGHPPRDALVVAMGTAGRAVVFAGATVVVSMLGLLLVGIGMLSGMGIGISVTVLATMFTSVTLLPALIAMTGGRLEVTRWRGLLAAGGAAVALLGVGIDVTPLVAVGVLVTVSVLVAGRFVPDLRREVPHRAAKPAETTLSHRWSRTIQRRPWPWAVAAAVVLVVLATPVLGLTLGWTDEGNFPEATDTRQAYDLLADGFGPGFNGPFVIVATTGPDTTDASIDDLHAALVATPGVAAVTAPVVDDPADPSAYLMTLIPTSAPQDEATTDLVRTLREDAVPAAAAAGLDVHVTGGAATNIDVTDYLAERMPLFFAAVLGVSFLVLLVVFRSVLVPLKAVLMNVLSIAATYGVVVAVFQWGWGDTLLGIEQGPINPFIPLMLFAIVFGLSMDYEVFMLSRIREEYDRTGDATTSVADGLASTARVITAAAAIMVVVFGSFVFEDIREIKVFGLGLALAVFLDATLVRMVLVPATMALLGDRNWWMPRWLDRLVPHVTVEAASSAAPPATADPGAA